MKEKVKFLLVVGVVLLAMLFLAVWIINSTEFEIGFILKKYV